MEFNMSPDMIDRLAFALLAVASWITIHLAREESN
jgi:hypothetical protein